METTFPVTIDPTDHTNRNELRASQIVVQQYTRYPSTLESELQSASPLGSARSLGDAHKSPALHRKDHPRSLQFSPKGPSSDVPPSAVRSVPSMSPALSEAMSQHQMKNTTDQVESRELPSRDVTNETIDDAYVLFILYCNPNVPSTVDTSELRNAFRCPPRSDGKSFNTFTLFELIRKLQTKELRTWVKLAIELGVEPPSMEKKQSTQKVQQYAVRLKVRQPTRRLSHCLISYSVGCTRCTWMPSLSIAWGTRTITIRKFPSQVHLWVTPAMAWRWRKTLRSGPWYHNGNPNAEERERKKEKSMKARWRSGLNWTRPWARYIRVASRSIRSPSLRAPYLSARIQTRMDTIHG